MCAESFSFIDGRRELVGATGGRKYGPPGLGSRSVAGYDTADAGVDGKTEGTGPWNVGTVEWEVCR